MPDKDTATAAPVAPASLPPVGTPPAGGRWTWANGQWTRLPEADAAPAPASAEPVKE